MKQSALATVLGDEDAHNMRLLGRALNNIGQLVDRPEDIEPIAVIIEQIIWSNRMTYTDFMRLTHRLPELAVRYSRRCKMNYGQLWNDLRFEPHKRNRILHTLNGMARNVS